MADVPLVPVLRHLRRIAGAGGPPENGDEQLLERYARRRDPAAFEELLRRHGPMVWRVCRRFLRDAHEAEDAFQATFLALVRQAGSLRKPAALSSWLHGVAYRIAHKAFAKGERRRALPAPGAGTATPDPVQESARRELVRAIEEEVASLPEKYRAPLLLCYWEGKTGEEVARQLRWPCGTVRTRLIMARRLLHERLARRGLALPAGVVALLLAPGAGEAALPPAHTLVAAVRATSARVSASAPANPMTEGVPRATFLSNLKISGLALAAALALATGGELLHGPSAGRTAPPQRPVVAAKPDTSLWGRPGAGSRAAPVDRFGDPLPPGALARMGTVRLFHGGDLLDPSTLFAFAPDGKTLASHIDRMAVALWDTTTGKEIRRLAVDRVGGVIASLAYSADGKTLITVNRDLTICLWEAATGKLRRKIEPGGIEGKKARSPWNAPPAFLPDGRILSLAECVEPSADGRWAYVWDVATGKEVCRLSEPAQKTNSPLRTAAFAPDGRLLATLVDCDKGISLWDLATGKEVERLTMQDADTSGLAFSRDGKRLAAADSKALYVWQTATGKLVRTFPSGRELGGPLAWSPDGKTLLAGPEGRCWDVSNGQEGCSLRLKNGRTALFSPDGTIVAVGDNAGVIRLFEATGGKEVAPRAGHRRRIGGIAYSPDGKTLATVGDDRTLRLWDPATGAERRRLAADKARSCSLAYSPDGKLLASVEGKTVCLRESATGKEVRQLKGEQTPAAVAFSPDGSLLAVSVPHWEPSVHLWDVTTGKVVRTLATGSRGDWLFLPVAFSPDGRLLATRAESNTVALWEVATGRLAARLGGLDSGQGGAERSVRFLAFSPNGRMVASSSRWDDNIRLWEVATGKEVWLLGGSGQKDGSALAFSPDGRILASAAQGVDRSGFCDRSVHLWDPVTGREIGRLAGHQQIVRAMTFSPDGKTLASCGGDLTCLVWDLAAANRVKPGRR
jgi:RNA polymerase sigma factor (sigma-70 family)